MLIRYSITNAYNRYLTPVKLCRSCMSKLKMFQYSVNFSNFQINMLKISIFQFRYAFIFANYFLKLTKLHEMRFLLTI